MAGFKNEINVFLLFFSRDENILDHDGKNILAQVLSIRMRIEILQSSTNAFFNFDGLC